MFRSHLLVLPWRWTIVLKPDGVECRRRRARDRLLWDDHSWARDRRDLGWWIIEGRPRGIAARIALKNVSGTCHDPHWSYYDKCWVVDDRFFPDLGGTRILKWLCVYLAIAPEARAGLGDPRRAAALVSALARQRIRNDAYPPHEPLMGPRLDVFNAVERVLHDRVRLLGGRRVDSDPPPSIDELVPIVCAGLPKHLPDKWKEPNVVRAEVERRLFHNQPWPFGVLTDGEKQDV